ncbi:MAG: phosphatase PAP2 family protein [Candidatus Methylomirabilales bacterium]
MADLDLFLFRAINRDLSNALFDLLMPFITDPGPFVVPFAGAGIGLLIWGGRKGRLAVVTALVLLLVSNSANELVKFWIQRPRPCKVLEAVRLLVGCTHSLSFPSSHAANITAQALLFAYLYRPLAVPLFLIAAAVGYSRIYVGVHYPADVVGGVLVGLICAAGLILLAREVERRLPSHERRDVSEVRGPKSEV